MPRVPLSLRLSAWGLLLSACAGSETGAGPSSALPAASAEHQPEQGLPPSTAGSGERKKPVASPDESRADPDLPLSSPAVDAEGKASTHFVSDLCALPGESNGWGPIERDSSNGEVEANDGGPITIASTIHLKGLGTHAPATVAYDLGGRCTRLSALVGVDDEMKNAGSVRFQVWGDGVLLAETPVLTGSDPAEPLEVELAAVRELRLVVDEVEGEGSDHADWADARLSCSGALEQCAASRPPAPSHDGYQLIWADEFDGEGPPNPEHWSFEQGFVRNEEAQWYQPENAVQRAGFLIIEGRREQRPNPRYQAQSGDWKLNREFAEYTSSSLHTRGKQSFQFGRLEMRGRFPAYAGLWPAWWTLGTGGGDWPWNGEIDILEYYGGALHANFVVGTNTQWVGNWDAVATPLSSLGAADWDARFHVYRMDWDETAVALYVDGQLLNEMNIAELRNPDGTTPFQQPHYMLLNLAIGGQAGGDPSAVPFPVRYEVDYVRAYARVP